MPEIRNDAERFRNAFLLLLVAGVSLLFLATIRRFLVALLLAALVTGIARPLYRRLHGWLRGRRSAAALSTIAVVLLAIIVPMLGFMGIVTAQALEVAEGARPWIQERVAEQRDGELFAGLELPRSLRPYQSQILEKLGQLAGRAGNFLVESLAAATRGTVNFLFMLFVMLYAMFFFLRDGPAILDRILYYMPLAPDAEERMVEKFVSVTRATIKGTLVIGVTQGALAGLAFGVVGIRGAAFWGTVMAVLSIIPGVGTALVWIPAVVYLLATGQTAAAIGLAVWCAGVVGTADNFLRPRLVGRDTELSDLLILLSTLGGLLLFGALGILIGPIVAALFVTVWDLYGVAFREYLPETGRAPKEAGAG